MDEALAKTDIGMGQLRQRPISERLKSEKEQHASEIKRIDRALEILEANPQVNELLDLLNGHRY